MAETEGTGGLDGTVAFCVLGMHRSGTSLVTSLLGRMGMSLGPEQSFLPAAPDNQQGFYEQQEIFEVNEGLLTHYGGAWHEIPNLPGHFAGDATLDPLRERARAVLASLYKNSTAWVVKDPRFSLTLPFWEPFLPQATRYVVCVRHPEEVAASLAKRNSFDFHKSLELWRRYTQAALRNTLGTARLIVAYGTGEGDWRFQVDQLRAFVRDSGLELPESPDAAELAAGYAGRYHHHREQPESLLRAWSSLHAEGVLYNAVLAQAGGPRLRTESLQVVAEAGVRRIREKDTQLERMAKERDEVTHERILEILLRESEEALARERQAAALRRVEIAQLIDEIGTERSRLAEEATRRAELEERVALLEQEGSELAEREAAALRHTRYLEAEREAIVTSRSWRLTAPVRALRQTVVESLRRWLRVAVRLQIERIKSAGRPSVRLVPPSGRLPAGWLRLELVYDDVAWVPTRGVVQAEFGPDSRSDEFELAAPVDSRLVAYAEFDHPSRGLRLVDPDGGDSASLESAVVRPVSFLEVLAHHLVGRLRLQSASPHGLRTQFRKLRRALFGGGLSGLIERLKAGSFGDQPETDYAAWVDRYGSLDATDRERIARRIASFDRLPRFSVLMPLQAGGEERLRDAVASLRGQLYPHWDLLIVDEGSTEPAVRRVLNELSAVERISVVSGVPDGEPAAVLNSGLERATGEWIVMLGPQDLLAEEALYRLAEELQIYPRAGLVYSDEDRLSTDGERRDPCFKPAHNPDLLLSYDFIGRVAAYRRDLVDSLGAFRPGLDGAHEYDLTLRITEQLPADEVRHVPEVLYHRRAPGPTAADDRDASAALESSRRAVRDHLERRGVAADVLPAGPGLTSHRVRYHLPPDKPLVSVLIPTRDRVELLERAVSSILERTTYPSFEVLILDNGSVEPATLDYFDRLREDPRVRVERYDESFNFSAINNFGASRARGTVLGLVNSDVELISPRWLEELVAHALRPEIGAVGARLYYPDGRLQHGGVVLGIGGVAGHAHKYLRGDRMGYMRRARVVQNFSAVTAACLFVRRDTYESLGGLDESLPIAFNDVDLCLRLIDHDLRNLWTPYAELYHHESLSRGPDDTGAMQERFVEDAQRMVERWSDRLLNDPCYSPNLTLRREDFSFAFPPRARRPWREASARRRSPGRFEDAPQAEAERERFSL